MPEAGGGEGIKTVDFLVAEGRTGGQWQKVTAPRPESDRIGPVDAHGFSSKIGRVTFSDHQGRPLGW
jgi:hypothetical protein